MKLTTIIRRCIILASFIITNSFVNNQISDAQVYQLMDTSGVTTY